MAAKNFDLVVVGDLNIDMVLTGMERMPVLDREEMAADMAITIGGSSANVACTASRLGLKVALVAQVGHDHFGRLLLERVQQAGVDTRGVIVSPDLKTGVSVAMVIEGQRGFASFTGAMGELRFEQVDLDLVAQGRHLHTGSFYLLKHVRPRLRELFAYARDSGLSTSLDVGDDPAQEYRRWLPETLEATDYFVPNELELCHAAGADDCSRAAQTVLRWTENVIVKRGDRGSAWFSRAFQAEAPAFRVPVADTTGAGDAYNAGLLVAILGAQTPKDALAFANAVGGISVGKPGGSESVSGLDEVQRLLAGPQPAA